MGYRLNIRCFSDPRLNFYGTKLYGYQDPEKLKSKQYLKTIFPDYDVDASYYEGDPHLTLTADEFEQFIKLYSEDWFAYSGESLSKYEGFETIELMLRSPFSKELSWF